MTDDKLIFSDDQALTVTADSTSTLDLGALTDDRGVALSEFGPEGNKIMLDVLINVAFAGGTNVAFKLQDSADDSTFADTQILVAAIAAATLVAGYRVMRIALPPDVQRYVKMVYTITGTHTAGKVNARLRYGAQT